MKLSLQGFFGPSRRSDESSKVQRAIAGDRTAFDELVHEYESELRIFLGRKVGFSDAEDLLQDVWIAAWNAKARFDRRSRFKTWLYGIALNKCRDFYRSRPASHQGLSLDADSTEIAVNETQFQRTELQQLLGQILSELSQTQREVLELYYFAELSLPEIGQLLNRNLNTVKYQFYRAHEEAAQRLKPALEIKTDAGNRKNEHRLQ